MSINRTEFLNCLEDEDFKSQVVNIAREREKYQIKSTLGLPQTHEINELEKEDFKIFKG